METSKQHNNISVIEITKEEDSASIEGTLRNAIDTANKTPDVLTTLVITPKVKTIYLTEGELIINSKIILKSISGKKVNISSSTRNRLFKVLDVSVFEIDGGEHQIIIKNGKVDTKGGAFLVESSDNTLILKNVIVKDNSATLGGAIFTQGKIIAIKSEFYKNVAKFQGGAIWAAKTVTLTKSKVTENTVSHIDSSSGGGGLFVDNGDLIATDNSSISYNECLHSSDAGGSGGGIVVMTGSIFISKNTKVNHNKAFNSGGIQEGFGNIWLLEFSSVSHNKSFNPGTGAAGGGGITISLGTTYVSQSEISYNETVGMYSGGIVSFIGDVIVENKSQIKYNSNRGPGGGIACNFNGSIVVSGGSSVSHNIGASLGGGIVNFSLQAGLISIGGGSSVSHNILTNAQTIGQTLEAFISVLGDGHSSNLVSQAKFSGGEGGKKLLEQLPSLISKGKEIANKMKELIPLLVNRYDRYKSIGGGGIAALLFAPIILSDNAKVTGNAAGAEIEPSNSPTVALGGGIFGFLSDIQIDNSIVVDNCSTGSGGGIFSGSKLTTKSATIHSNNIESDRSNAQGGGIFIRKSGVAILIDSHITKNSTNGTGGGISNRGSLTLISTEVECNHAGKMHDNIFSTNPPIILNSE